MKKITIIRNTKMFKDNRTNEYFILQDIYNLLPNLNI